jgi:hypothetical protein
MKIVVTYLYIAFIKKKVCFFPSRYAPAVSPCVIFSIILPFEYTLQYPFNSYCLVYLSSCFLFLSQFFFFLIPFYIFFLSNYIDWSSPMPVGGGGFSGIFITASGWDQLTVTKNHETVPSRRSSWIMELLEATRKSRTFVGFFVLWPSSWKWNGGRIGTGKPGHSYVAFPL